MLESDLDIEVDPSNAFFFNPKCEILYDDQNNRLAIIDASEFIHQIRAELAPGVEPAWVETIAWAQSRPGYVLETVVGNVDQFVPGLIDMFERFGMDCATYTVEE